MHAEDPKMRTIPRPECLLCGGKGEPLYQSLSDRLFGAPGTSDFKQCPNKTCGLIWLDPAPSPQDLHLAYRNYFTHERPQEVTDAAEEWREFLYRCYQNLASLPAALVGLQSAKRKLATMFLEDLPPGKLLDVGCGDGVFLSRMRAAHWAVDGVDFDPKAIENARLRYGLDLHHGDLLALRLPENSFDAVTLSHVIEHVPDPVALLQEVRRILKPGARTVITTPNNGSLGHLKFGQYWFGLDPPRHLFLFSPNSLNELARLALLKPLHVNSTAANADIFLGGSFSIQSASDHRIKPQPSLSMLRTVKAVWWQYQEHFALSSRPHCGEEAVLIATKD
jgi:ubiquinone/menaquinone biosynthesis C-methylase UbiE